MGKNVSVDDHAGCIHGEANNVTFARNAREMTYYPTRIVAPEAIETESAPERSSVQSEYKQVTSAPARKLKIV